MTHQVHVVSDVTARPSEETVRLAGLAALTFEDAPQGSLSVVLADSDSVRKLNLQFRQTDSPTDVLSFPDGSPEPDSDGVYFGDIVIAIPIAEAQAKEAGHPLESELALLTVHGVLHLLGHDHGTQAEKVTMWTRQAAILRQLAIKVRIPE
jgi:probable rRNA maturation factor